MKSVLCYGDSNTWGLDPVAGCRMSAEVRWPGVLRHLLGPDYDIIEEGLPGRTTVWADPVEEVMSGRDYLLPCLKSHQPLDMVILMLGTNDLKQRYSASPLDIALGVLSLVNVIERELSQGSADPSAPQSMVLIPPPIKETGLYAQMFLGGEEKSRLLGKSFKEILQASSSHVVDTSSEVAMSAVDGIHLDAPAHLALAHLIAREIKRVEQIQ